MRITKKIAAKVLETVDAGLVSGVGNPIPGQMCVEAAVCYALGLPHGDEPTCVSPALRALKITLNDAQWSSPTARALGLRRLAVIQLGSKDALDEHEFAKRVSRLAIRVSMPLALRAAASLFGDTSEYKKNLLDAADLCEIEGSADAAANAAASAADAAANAAANAAASAAADVARAASAAADVARAASAADAAAYAAAYAADVANAAADAAARAAEWAANAAANAAASAADAAAYAADADKSLSDFAEHVVQILIDMGVPGVEWLSLT